MLWQASLIARDPVPMGNQNEETASFQLPDLVVTASGYEQAMREAPASISMLSRAELESIPFNDLSDALRDLPGVQIAPGKVGHDVGLRGMGADYTLILVDGRRQDSRETRPNGFAEAETGFIPPPAAIERIEVVRGPMSTLHGSDAMGGVINIITRKRIEEWGGSIGFDTTQQLVSKRGDAYSGNFYLAGPIIPKKLGLTVFGRVFQRAEDDMGITGASPARRGARRAEHDSLNTRLTYAPVENQEISLEAGQSVQRYEGTDGKTGYVGQANAYDPVQRYQRRHLALVHRGQWERFFSEVSLQHEKAETRGRLNNDGSPRPLEITNTVIDAKFTIPMRKHTLHLGGQYWEAAAEDGLRNNAGQPVVGELSMEQKSLFGEDTWALNHSLSLTAGARWDHHDSFGDHFSPRVYLVWNLHSDWVVKGGMSEGFKAPRMTQTVDGIRGLGRQGTLPLLGNPDLKPETSRTYEAGIYYERNGWINGSLVVFFNEFKDKISSEDIPNDGSHGDWPQATVFNRPINVDTAETKGAEASVTIHPMEGWRLRTNYTYIESRQTSGPNEGQPLNAIPRHQLNSTLSWSISEKWDIWTRASWRSREWRNATDSAYAGYAVFDLGTSYQLNEAVTLNAGLYNLANKDTTDSDRYPHFIDGRRLWLSSTIRF